MRRRFEIEMAQSLYIAAPDVTCGACHQGLIISEHRKRFVQRCDDLYRLVRQFKWCQTVGCEWYHKGRAPLVDLRFALPGMTFGTDVILELGERHLSHCDSLTSIGKDLTSRGVPISQRNTCALLRAYIGLAKASRGDDEVLRCRLREQGGIVLMADGVQYDKDSPVLYLVWDAISGEPLFGERKPFRGAEDLVPLLERVKAMGVPIIAAVSDKETGLLPAIAAVLPDVRHQLCQFHFLKNCASVMDGDLQALGTSVEERAERVQKIAKRLHEKGFDSIESEHNLAASPAPVSSGGKSRYVTENDELTEEQLTSELCAMARHASRRSGRAPLNPPALVRHNELERVRSAVQRAKKKKTANIRS
jgi:hypothetical protein